MEIAGIYIGFWTTMGLFCVILATGFWLVERSQDKLARNRHKTWSPDVDQQKAETVRNHSPGGMNR